MKYRYEEMLPSEFLEAVQRMPLFIQPTGLLEWHADHLPLGQDTLKSEGICLRLAEAMGGGIVLPPNYFGRPGFSTYTGTLTYSEGMLDCLFTEHFAQLRKVGARVILVLTGHYGACQVDFIKRVASNFMREYPDVTVIAQPEYEGVTIDGRVPADHAGLWETSMFWYMRPELTRMDLLQLVPAPMKRYLDAPHDFYKESADWKFDESILTASRELGKRAVDAIVEHLCGVLRDALAR